MKKRELKLTKIPCVSIPTESKPNYIPNQHMHFALLSHKKTLEDMGYSDIVLGENFVSGKKNEMTITVYLKTEDGK